MHHRQIYLSLLSIFILFGILFAGGLTLLRAELLAIQTERMAGE